MLKVVKCRGGNLLPQLHGDLRVRLALVGTLDLLAGSPWWSWGSAAGVGLAFATSPEVLGVLAVLESLLWGELREIVELEVWLDVWETHFWCGWFVLIGRLGRLMSFDCLFVWKLLLLAWCVCLMMMDLPWRRRSACICIHDVCYTRNQMQYQSPWVQNGIFHEILLRTRRGISRCREAWDKARCAFAAGEKFSRVIVVRAGAMNGLIPANHRQSGLMQLNL